MSSVRNRILQFQQKDDNSSANANANANGSNGCSVMKNGSGASINGNGNGHSTVVAPASSSALKSSYVRTKSFGSIPPDIVATAVVSNGANHNHNQSQNQRAALSSINSYNNNNISVSTSSLKPFPYGSSSTISQKNQQHSNNNSSSTNGNGNGGGSGYFGNNYGLKTASGTSSPSSVTSSATSSLINIRKYSNGGFSDCSSSTTSLASSWRSGSVEKRSPAPEPSQATIVRTVEIPLGNGNGFEQSIPPVVNRANKPGALAMKKASMSINLSGGSHASSSSNSPSPTGNSSSGGNSLSGFGGSGSNNRQGMNGTRGSRGLLSPDRPKVRAPTKPTTVTSPISNASSIPKLSGGGGSAGFGFGSNGSVNGAPTTVRYRDPSPGGIGRSRGSPAGSNRGTPVTTPTGPGGGGVAFGSTWSGSGSTMGRFYQSISWKEKFEESEKKKDHLVGLAQKATRDYEELRRRYHEIYTDHEKLVTRFESATSQLESLRKASEATYDAYHKLRRRYEAENQEKSDALGRVDEYNKENRRLKRQSALMMQQIDPSTLLAQAHIFDTVPEGESAESDKEIQYLRQKAKEMEAKIIDLESELERIRLSEFESQESVLLLTDSVQTSNTENLQLKDRLRRLDEENRKLARSLEDLSLEHESLRAKQSVEGEKLQVAESELKKLLTEKNILQRQSLVFMNNDELDNRLLDALAQIEELQRAKEYQKNEFEVQIQELKDRLSEKESVEETNDIQQSAKIRALEEELQLLRERAEEAERKLEDCSTSSTSSTEGSPAPPPPPPPPPMMGSPAPPPPPPPPSMNFGNGISLGSSLQSAMTSLKKGSRGNLESAPNGSCDGQSKNVGAGSPHIDDIVSQLKQGIKLRHIDRPRKQIVQEKSMDDNPVQELRSVLDNMRKSRTVDRRFEKFSLNNV